MGYLCLFIHVLFEKTMFYLYFSLFNKNIHEVKNIAIHIVSCHTYRDTYRIVKMCIVTSLMVSHHVSHPNPIILTGMIARVSGMQAFGAFNCVVLLLLFLVQLYA